MPSIPLVMTLDMLRRGRWTLLGLLAVGNALPLLVLTALGAEGSIQPDDSSHITMHLVLTQMNMWLFCVGVVSAQGPVSKLYTLPITTTSIVAWRMLLLVVLAVAEALLSTLLINALFGVDWPLWGPTLLLAAALAVAQAIVWYGDQSAWSVPMLGLLALGYGSWMRSHYGGWWSPPDRYWRDVSLADVAIIAATFALAFGLGVAGVARRRRGEPPLSLGIMAWLDRVFQGKLGAAEAFRSPGGAQFWYEWRKKGWAMPVGAVFGLVLGFVAWLIFSRNPGDLWEGVFVLGGSLSVLAFVAGIIHGNNGPTDANFELGGFLATRPLTTTSLANILLKTCGLSVLAAWLIWASALAGIWIVLRATAAAPTPLLSDQLHWAYYPLTLLGPWVVVTLFTSVGLSGRMVGAIAVGLGLTAAWIGLKLLVRVLLLPPEAQEVLDRGASVVAGGLALAYALSAFVFARRRGLIDWPVVLIAGGLWMALSIAAMLVLGNAEHPLLQTLATIALATGLIALAVAPLASAPLALAWNRNR